VPTPPASVPTAAPARFKAASCAPPAPRSASVARGGSSVRASAYLCAGGAGVGGREWADGSWQEWTGGSGRTGSERAVGKLGGSLAVDLQLLVVWRSGGSRTWW
jgi:hypothetical protein